MDTKIILIIVFVIVILITVIPVFKMFYKELMKDPEKLQELTDTTFDNLSKENLKEKWANAEALARAEVEAEEAYKAKIKKDKEIEKILKKEAKKFQK